MDRMSRAGISAKPVVPAVVVDTSGRFCPGPVVDASDTARQMELGEVLELSTTDLDSWFGLPPATGRRAAVPLLHPPRSLIAIADQQPVGSSAAAAGAVVMAGRRQQRPAEHARADATGRRAPVLLASSRARSAERGRRDDDGRRHRLGVLPRGDHGVPSWRGLASVAVFS
jgi:hypothetical protein